MKLLNNKLFFIALSSILALEMISWLSYANLTYNKIFFAIIILVTLILASYKLEWGIYILLAELFIGSKGYLLSYSINDFSLSLRLGLFLAVFLAFLIDVIKTRKIYFFHNKFRNYYLALIGALLMALAVGYFKGNALSNIFFDANGYLFFGLIFPITQSFHKKEKFINILSVLSAAVIGLIFKTLLLLFIFSQGNFFGIILIAVYKWVRDTGVGEITQMPNGFSRIFMQSHIYAIVFFFLGALILSLISYKEFIKKYWWLWFITTSLSLLVIFISYSRSFWLGAIIILFIFFISLLFYWRVKLKKIFLIALIMMLVALADYGLVLGMINLPLPGNNAVSASSLVSERTKDPTSEAAGSSRMELLRPLFNKNLRNPVLGGGFGTTVTYKTKDPRALAANPDGNYTTYAFEWGYLDLWLKLGAYGLIIYLCLLFKIFIAGYRKISACGESASGGKQEKSQQEKVIIFGSLLGALAIIIIHFFTPYLNHPLGIGWLLLIGHFYTITSDCD